MQKKSPRARPGRGRRLARPARSSEYDRLVENMVDRFAGADTGSAVADAAAILVETRKQYDEVHTELTRKTKELDMLRQLAGDYDNAHAQRMEGVFRHEDLVGLLERQLDDAREEILKTRQNRKVYEHMLERLKKEHSVLKQKIARMETHLARKKKESGGRMDAQRSLQQDAASQAEDLQQLQADLGSERDARDRALGCMDSCVEAKTNTIRRRTKFEQWRHTVQLEAANSAFNRTAGKLRLMWALEKLSGNCLHQIHYEQVEKSQSTEDGFQKIREVTGLTDVMDIVHKFLNREGHCQQLKSAVTEAEHHLDRIVGEYEQLKRKLEGVVPLDRAGAQRGFHKELEGAEAEIVQKTRNYASAKERAEKLRLLLQGLKRWAKMFNQSMKHAYEEAQPLDSYPDVVKYFQGLEHTVERFCQWVHSHEKRKKGSGQPATPTAFDKSCFSAEFMRLNNRLPEARADEGERRELGDPEFNLCELREKYKKDSDNVAAEASRKKGRYDRKKR